MPDDLYDLDILSWAEHQADLLRRLARGERVNEVDWTRVVEEIEDVGLSELHAVESYLNPMLVNLLRVHLSPDSQTLGHWDGEMVAFQRNAARRFAPSMRQRIDLTKLYADAVDEIEASGYRGTSPITLPPICPFALDELLRDKWDALEARLNAPLPEGPDLA